MADAPAAQGATASASSPREPPKVTAMARLNKFMDARASTRGMTMMMMSSKTNDSVPAIDPDHPGVCADCGASASYIASAFGEESALCKTCAPGFARKWSRCGHFMTHSMRDSVFILTLDDVRALDASKPRVKVTQSAEELQAMLIPATAGAHASSQRAAIRARIAAAMSESTDTGGGSGAGEIGEMGLPALRISVTGCACCSAKSQAHSSTIAEFKTALLLNKSESSVQDSVSEAIAEWPKGALVYWTNEDGGVMLASFVPTKFLVEVTSEKFAERFAASEGLKQKREAQGIMLRRLLVDGLKTAKQSGMFSEEWVAASAGSNPVAIHVQTTLDTAAVNNTDDARSISISTPLVSIVPVADFSAFLLAGKHDPQEDASEWDSGNVRVFFTSPEDEGSTVKTVNGRRIVASMFVARSRL